MTMTMEHENWCAAADNNDGGSKLSWEDQRPLDYGEDCALDDDDGGELVVMVMATMHPSQL